MRAQQTMSSGACGGRHPDLVSALDRVGGPSAPQRTRMRQRTDGVATALMRDEAPGAGAEDVACALVLRMGAPTVAMSFRSA